MLHEDPPPSGTSAFSVMSFAQRRAEIWAQDEAGLVHELLHVMLSALEDVYEQVGRKKRLNHLWNRREEKIVCILEKVICSRS